MPWPGMLWEKGQAQDAAHTAINLHKQLKRLSLSYEMHLTSITENVRQRSVGALGYHCLLFVQAELIKGLSDKGIFRFQGAGVKLKGQISK